MSAHEVTIESNPTRPEISNAWASMSFDVAGLPDVMCTRSGWTDYMTGSHLLYFPIIVYSGNRPEVVIWMTDYDPEVRTAQINFVTAHNMRNPVGVARAVRRGLHKRVSIVGGMMGMT